MDNSYCMDSAKTNQFLELVRKSLDDHSLVKLTLGKCRGPERDLEHIYIRPVVIRGARRLSFVSRYKTRDVTGNLPADRALKRVGELLGGDFLSAHLFTKNAEAQIEFNKRREPRLTLKTAAAPRVPQESHDRRKQRIIDPAGAPYLSALGVTDSDGRPLERMSDKLRQIQRYVEILRETFRGSEIEEKRELSMVDMGCGKGYLTFAAYDFFNRVIGKHAAITGVESRAELVDLCNRVAGESRFDGLHFVCGTIQDFHLPKTDILMALHACDTATDDAIYKGIVAGAAIILAAPCCHKEIRPQLKPAPVLRDVLKFGIHAERAAEMVTDSLRALWMEYAGYKTRVFEFIATEHTSKNLLIVGVRRKGRVEREGIERRIVELKAYFGIEKQHLEQLLLRYDLGGN
jgi:SAM-dependent methyltransferase